MDPLSSVRIAQVTPGSWGAEAGFQAGDELRELAGQPLVSMADVQWVLHNTAEQANLSAIVERQGNREALTLRLPAGWRETGDISWRATSWPLRGKVLGGMRLRTLTPEESEQAGSNTGIGFFVHGVGQYGIHQAAKRAGVKPNDIVLSIAGMNQPMTESQLLVNLMRSTKPGDVIQIEVLRDGKPRTIELPIQE